MRKKKTYAMKRGGGVKPRMMKKAETLNLV